MKTLRFNSRLLVTGVMLQAIILLILWGLRPAVSNARADGILDAGAQREQLIEQMKITNEKLDKILTLLANGDLKVTVKSQDENSKR